MPYDKSKPYSCPCCGYWNGDMKYDYYKHKKPLIKDERIRKAVRAWAEACGYDGACIVEYDKRFNELSGIAHTTVIALGEIDFDLEDRKRYTIAELCGEEEE